MATSSRSNKCSTFPTMRLLAILAVMVAVIIGIYCGIGAWHTKSLIKRINGEAICSVKRGLSPNRIFVELADDAAYNRGVLEQLADAHFGFFAEITVIGFSGSSIPATPLAGVSEIHISDDAIAGTDIARLATAFPNCHIWVFDTLPWTESIRTEIAKLPSPSGVYVSSEAPKDAPGVASIKNTSVFWDPSNGANLE